jgi:hypothetical protein
MRHGCKPVRHKGCCWEGPRCEHVDCCISVLAEAHKFRNAPMPWLALSAVKKRRGTSLLDSFFKCNAGLFLLCATLGLEKRKARFAVGPLSFGLGYHSDHYTECAQMQSLIGLIERRLAFLEVLPSLSRDWLRDHPKSSFLRVSPSQWPSRGRRQKSRPYPLKWSGGSGTALNLCA